MTLNKFSKKSDAIANLYRAALYLARGSRELGLKFLSDAQKVLGKTLGVELSGLITNKDKVLKNQKDNLFWAEKILDRYHGSI